MSALLICEGDGVRVLILALSHYCRVAAVRVGSGRVRYFSCSARFVSSGTGVSGSQSQAVQEVHTFMRFCSLLDKL